jgi:hypothetical protein
MHRDAAIRYAIHRLSPALLGTCAGGGFRASVVNSSSTIGGDVSRHPFNIEVEFSEQCRHSAVAPGASNSDRRLEQTHTVSLGHTADLKFRTKEFK